MTTDQKNLILKLDRKGKINKDIQKETGLSAGTISMFLKKCREEGVDHFTQCPNCFKEITIYKKRRSRIERIYCSQACKKAYYKRTGIEKTLKKTCECCGKEFMTYPYRIRRFCCKSCAMKYRHMTLQKKELKTIWLAYIQWAISDGFFVESKVVLWAVSMKG